MAYKGLTPWTVEREVVSERPMLLDRMGRARGLTVQDQLGLWIVLQEFEVFCSRHVGTEAARLSSKSAFMLGIQPQREDVPGVDLLAVFGSHRKGDDLVLCERSAEE